MNSTQRSPLDSVAGHGQYLADLPAEGCLEVVFVRSQLPRARIASVSVPAGHGMSGADLCAGLAPVVIEGPGLRPCPWLPMVTDHARYVGDILAAVWAEARYEAEDLADSVEVDYEPVPEGTPLHAHIPDNVLYEQAGGVGDVDAAFAAAPRVFERRFRTARQSPFPLECRGVVADYDAVNGRVELWTSTQVPNLVRRDVALCLRLDESAVRVRVPQVGGGFGGKAQVSPEEVALAALARRLGRRLRWVEDRFENLVAASHAHDVEVRLRVAVDASGRVTGVDAEVDDDVGAWAPLPFSVSTEPATVTSSLFGAYAMSAFRFRVRALASSRCPVGAYRGVGINAGVYATERMMDVIARELGVDRLELRRRNAVTAFPVLTPAGRELDSGDYRALLARLEQLSGYDDLLRWRDEQREQGRLVGIGIGFFNEHSGTGSSDYRKRGNTSMVAVDGATVRVTAEGRIEILTSAADAGQSHAETYRLIAERELGVPADKVDVIEGDTGECPEGVGTFASRTAVGGFDSLVHALRTAAARDLEPGTVETRVVDPHQVFPSGAHLAVVEVDPVSLVVRVLRYFAVEDCGTVLNPPAVEGQVRGGIAMGIGDVLLSEHHYSEDGQLLTASLLDYLLPVATDVPDLTLDHIESPSPATVLGTKGVGEGGTIGAYGAVGTAVADALAGHGVEVNSLPCSPGRLYEQVVQAGALEELDRAAARAPG